MVGLLIRIACPILIGWIFFKLVEYLTSKISIRDYKYNGEDSVLNTVKVIWYYSENKKLINGTKYSNNKYYFKIFTQFFKVGMYDVIIIDDKNGTTYDFSTIVIFDKREMGLKTRFKLIKWLIFEWVKNKIEPTRKKDLPNFLIEPYILTDALYLNMGNLYKNFKINDTIGT